MAAGNRTVLVIIDSRKGAARRTADTTIFAALDHFGVAWEVLDGGDYMGALPAYVAPRALYLIAHDGAAEWLSEAAARQIADCVTREGAGLASFDRELAQWPAPLRELAGEGLGSARTGALRFADTPHFITTGHEPGEGVELFDEVELAVPVPAGDWNVHVTANGGDAVVYSRAVGAGRTVFFATGNALYDEGLYGHVRGLDGLLWRSLVWAAAKPFPMRCLPPYVTARMDDCNGTYSAFDYVRVMNRYGIGPNLGLFIDEMGPTDWAAAKRLHDAGGADFSMHAFRDDFYKARLDYRPYAVLADKPDLSDGGTQTLFEGLSLDHQTGLDLPAETLRRNWLRMDEAFARAGIRHSRVLNAHFGEVGFSAVPGFLARGVDMPCNNSALGQLYGNQPVWRPRPYGVRGATGRHGLTIDRCPQHPDFTIVAMNVSHAGKTHMTIDILSGRVPFIGESETPKLKEAAEAGSANIKLGLDALAWGLLFTHEERIDAISLPDWETVVEGVVAGLDGWEVQYAEREFVGIICKRLFDSRLVRANLTPDGLLCELCGRTDGPSPLTVWENEGDRCVRRVIDLDPIEGYALARI